MRLATKILVATALTGGLTTCALTTVAGADPTADGAYNTPLPTTSTGNAAPTTVVANAPQPLANAASPFDPGAQSNANSSLAFTGADIAGTAVIGTALIGGGVLFVQLGRRRRTT